MFAKKPLGSPEINPDDAPELTAEMLDRAEVFDGDKFVRRGRGRPPLDAPKEKINVRLDAAVLDRLRASGPGWQTRINAGMALLTGVDRRIWDWIDLQIATNEGQIKNLKQIVELMEAGAMRSFTDKEDTTDQCLRKSRDGIEQWTNAIRIMRDTQMDLLGLYGVDVHSRPAALVDDSAADS